MVQCGAVLAGWLLLAAAAATAPLSLTANSAALIDEMERTNGRTRSDTQTIVLLTSSHFHALSLVHCHDCGQSFPFLFLFLSAVPCLRHRPWPCGIANCFLWHKTFLFRLSRTSPEPDLHQLLQQQMSIIRTYRAHWTALPLHSTVERAVVNVPSASHPNRTKATIHLGPRNENPECFHCHCCGSEHDNIGIGPTSHILPNPHNAKFAGTCIKSDVVVLASPSPRLLYIALGHPQQSISSEEPLPRP